MKHLILDPETEELAEVALANLTHPLMLETLAKLAGTNQATRIQTHDCCVCGYHQVHALGGCHRCGCPIAYTTEAEARSWVAARDWGWFLRHFHVLNIWARSLGPTEEVLNEERLRERQRRMAELEQEENGAY